MSFFETSMPAIHALLSREVPKTTIDISDQGDVSIRRPNGDVHPIVEEILRVEGQMLQFKDLDDRPQILAFHKLRAVSASPSYGAEQRYHYSNLDKEFPNRAVRHFAEHYPDNSRLYRYPEFGGNEIPLVIVFGSELGWHLPRLLLEYRIRHLIVIDVDVESFRLSAFFNDYVLLSRLAIKQGTNLTFIVQPELENVSKNLMRVIRRGLPPFFIHGSALFYAMSDSETSDALRDSIIETLWEMFFGNGYFDDELIAIKHNFENLRQEFPIYLNTDVIKEDAIAVIVGSGPSLDGLIPLLREHREQVVIFSCGTSLSALANAGIKPDFHVEKERPYIVYELLTKAVDREFLKGIGFLGLNVVHPDVFNLFEFKGVIMKSADTMSLLLAQAGIPEHVILNTQPTVTNTAIDYALSAGFKKIFLAGVDVGYKDEEKHHSQHTVYLKDMPEDDHLKELLSKRPDSEKVVPGNFGGEVTTDKILDMTRRFMEQSIERYPDVKVYNLNDGALIKGAIPLRAEDFICDATPVVRAAAVEAIKGSFVKKEFDIEALGNSLLAQIDTFVQEVSTVFGQEQSTRSDVIGKIEKFYQYLVAEADAMGPTAFLFRGICYHLLSLTYNALTLIKDEEEALAKAEFDFGNLLDFFDQARAEIVNVIQVKKS